MDRSYYSSFEIKGNLAPLLERLNLNGLRRADSAPTYREVHFVDESGKLIAPVEVLSLTEDSIILTVHPSAAEEVRKEIALVATGEDSLTIK